MLTCQNATMALLAERLQGMGPNLNWPIADATGLEGGWDFSLIFSQMAMPIGIGPGRGGDGGGGGAGAGFGGDAPSAADPSGVVTIFQAIEKQLGLKLETQKKMLPVFVVDHLEQKPTEN
jgi:uncharacterized protein (TIGR03435 family)